MKQFIKNSLHPLEPNPPLALTGAAIGIYSRFDIGYSDSMKVILFDGYCVLCNQWVNSLLRILRTRTQDSARHPFQFASLQGRAGTEILSRTGRIDLKTPPLKSIVLYDGKDFFMESDAILKVVSDLGFPWAALGAFRVIPSFIRNAFYRLIATNRYRWFGKSDTCRLPTPEEREWLLD